MHASEAIGLLPATTPRQPTHPVLTHGCGLARRGLVREALEVLDHHRASAVLAPLGTDAALLLATSLDCRLARGDIGDALALGEMLAPYLDLPGTAGALAHHARGELASALNEPDAAAACFATAGVLLDDADDELVPWRAGAALAALRLGGRTEAAELARDQLLRAGDSPYATAQALRTLATTEPGTDRTALVRRARAALAGVPAERLAAQLDTDLAGLLLLKGGPRAAAEALTLLRSAEAYAGRQELWPLQSRVRRLLERLDAPPRRAQSEALAALTASERKVARLAADGLTNPQIAEELVVTVKAVEWHLSHVYRKLGIRSRTRLAATIGVTG
jgi:DNA-binding NarL/FixJ family response regulator